jgi:hypothetical protein
VSVRMTVWVDDLDDLAEFVDQLHVAPTLGRDDEGWYLAVDLTSENDGVDAEPSAGVAPSPVDDEPESSSPPPVPASAPSDLEQLLYDELSANGPCTAAELADVCDADADVVKETLRSMRDGNLVELAGVRGWKVRRRQFNPEAARLRAADSI